MPLLIALNKYIKNNLPNLIAIEKHYQAFKLPKQLPKVIDNAAIGIDPDGLMNNHQHRIGYAICEEGARELAKYEVEIRKVKSFEEIFEITERVKDKIFGLGNLWSYDTALRIGFAKKVYPKEVYVQSGVKKGVRKIMKGHLPSDRSLPLRMFPEALQKMKPYQLETFLCIYGKNPKRIKKKKK
jgi:hypothetical protein